MKDLSDEELLRHIKDCSAENESAEYISALISRYIHVIVIKANKRSSSRADCEDLISEGFIGLLYAVRAYNADKGSFFAFANTCIDNKMRTHLKTAGRRPEVADDFDLDTIEDSAPNADELLIKRESDNEFLSGIRERLSDFEYNVLTLYTEGYSYKQIAAGFKVSVKSVDNALSRARGKLKNLKK